MLCKKWIATLARFCRAIALICKELYDCIPCGNYSNVTTLHQHARWSFGLVYKGLTFVNLFYRTEKSMIFPRCWPRPCALINPANHISGDVHYSHITRTSKKCIIDVSVSDQSACSWLRLKKGKCGSGHWLHYTSSSLIWPDHLNIMRGMRLRDVSLILQG